VPDGADVYVDGSFVGDASTTLKLAPGKHAIRVVFKGYKDWSRELSVIPSSDVKLTARLDKQD
jgi:PEGA domain